MLNIPLHDSVESLMENILPGRITCVARVEHAQVFDQAEIVVHVDAFLWVISAYELEHHIILPIECMQF